jgi:hypothetical protein
MQLVSRKWAMLLALGAMLTMAWLASAPAADAAPAKYHITAYESGQALALSPNGAVVEAAPNKSLLRQQWIQLNQPGGTALWANASLPGSCLAAPGSATPTSVDNLVMRGCSSTLDKRLHWTRHTGVPFNAGVWFFNAHTGQMVAPELCIFGPCSGQPSLLPGSNAQGLGTFGEWRFKVLN